MSALDSSLCFDQLNPFHSNLLQSALRRHQPALYRKQSARFNSYRR